ncbi:MAG: DUF4876 domain-containing protein [Bacteroidales bacterium]|nr:DUF4876 domain-containing protein [Bacteroidales bacterium]MBD5229830.1 DUF4876 domain-containing protein [Bacteroidales bacterium]MBD5248272.1 DUF4876 domain-containing protein [Barnesiella sp.]
MKIAKFILAATLLGGMSVQLTSCSDDDTVAYYPVSVTVNLPAEIADATILDQEYTFKNVSTNEVKVFPSAEEIEVTEGLYDITYTAHVLMANGVETTMRAMQQSVRITSGENNVSLTAYNTIAADDLIISEVFNTGTTNATGGQNRDSYIKLYNNTDHVLYADGITFFESDFSTMQKYDYDPDLMPTHVIVRTLFTVPGDGTRFPVQPGEYFLMCDRANAASENSFDLTHADVEWYDESQVASQQDTDNPDVPNMDKVFSYSRSITILDQSQRAFGIARLGVDADTYLAEYAYTATYEMVLTAGTFPMTKKDCYKLPNEWVLDVVTLAPQDNYAWNVTSPSLDCGWSYVAQNTTDKTRFFKSVRRKMLYINEQGNPVLKDTNNSTDDFNARVTPSEIELQGTAVDADGTLCTTLTYDGVTPVK